MNKVYMFDNRLLQLELSDNQYITLSWSSRLGLFIFLRHNDSKSSVVSEITDQGLVRLINDQVYSMIDEYLNKVILMDNKCSFYLMLGEDYVHHEIYPHQVKEFVSNEKFIKSCQLLKNLLEAI